jgi:hypothetical protein
MGCGNFGKSDIRGLVAVVYPQSVTNGDQNPDYQSTVYGRYSCANGGALEAFWIEGLRVAFGQGESMKVKADEEEIELPTEEEMRNSRNRDRAWWISHTEKEIKELKKYITQREHEIRGFKEQLAFRKRKLKKLEKEIEV